MMEAVRTSETSVGNHFTRQYIPEDNSEHHKDNIVHVRKNNFLCIEFGVRIACFFTYVFFECFCYICQQSCETMMFY
jgi:hypothetical protein